MMGLQHLQEDMIKNGDRRSRLETVEDMKESCDIAVKTLSDMLLYDKIETGALVLDKVDLKIVSFVKKIVRLFQVQVSSVLT